MMIFDFIVIRFYSLFSSLLFRLFNFDDLRAAFAKLVGVAGVICPTVDGFSPGEREALGLDFLETSWKSVPAIEQLRAGNRQCRSNYECCEYFHMTFLVGLLVTFLPRPRRFWRERLECGVCEVDDLGS